MFQSLDNTQHSKNTIKPDAIGLYIHWPFCLAKCPYCDFNSHVADHVDHTLWAQRLEQEMRTYAAMIGQKKLHSIFFGGGTPSLMKPKTVAHLINTASALFTFTDDIEITLEANPTSIENAKFADFKAAGINRVSIGIQALNEEDLKFLGREHSAEDALNALKIADRHFERFSFDLIYARPNQDLKSWEVELTEAIKYAKGHLSLYQLTIEQGTAFYTRHQRGDFQIPNADYAGDLYEMTLDITAQAGLPAYEISNHAALGQESRHNLTYWQYMDYIGIGPGAHGRISLNNGKNATRGHRAPDIWLQRVQEHGHGSHEFEAITPNEQIDEIIMMGLRLKHPIPFDRLETLGQCDIDRLIDLEKIKMLSHEGYLTLTEDHLQTTEAGWQRLNSMLPLILK